MADTINFAGLNAITPTPGTDDAKILALMEDPPGVAPGYKPTLGDTAQYVGDVTVSGLSTTATNMIGAINELQSEITAEDIWDRTATTVTLKNAGDDIDLSTAGLFQSATFDSANISAYDSHPTFTADSQIVDKKYVDDVISAGSGITPEDLTSQLGAGGETSFTMSTTPVAGNKSLLVYNSGIQAYGIDYTISGNIITWISSTPLGDSATNSLWIFSDITITPPGTLDQIQILFGAKAGNDTNNGKSYETPFLLGDTLIAAANAVASSGTPYSAKFIDAGTYNIGASTVGAGVRVHMEDSIMSSGTTLGGDSEIYFNKITLGLGGLGFSCTTSGSRIIEGKKGLHSGSANPEFISSNNGATVLSNMYELDMNIAGGKTFNLSNSSSLYMFCNKYTPGQTSSVDGTSVAYIGTPNAMYKDDVKVFDIETGYFRDNTISAFKSYVSTSHSDVTGDGSVYTVIFQNDSTPPYYDLTNDYNTSTGQYTAAYDQIFNAGAVLRLGGIGASHEVLVSLAHKNSGGTTLEVYTFAGESPNSILDSAAQIRLEGSTDFKMSSGDTIEVVITGSGSTKTIDVLDVTSQFYGHVVTAL